MRKFLICDGLFCRSKASQRLARGIPLSNRKVKVEGEFRCYYPVYGPTETIRPDEKENGRLKARRREIQRRCYAQGPYCTGACHHHGYERVRESLGAQGLRGSWLLLLR